MAMLLGSSTIPATKEWSIFNESAGSLAR